MTTINPLGLDFPNVVKDLFFYISVYAVVGVVSVVSQYTGALRASHILCKLVPSLK